MNKELEEAIKVLEDIKDGSNICLTIELNRDKKDKEDIEHYKSEVKAIETVLNYIENSIPKKVIEEKIEELEDLLDLCKTDGRVSKYKIKALEEEIEDIKKILEVE